MSNFNYLEHLPDYSNIAESINQIQRQINKKMQPLNEAIACFKRDVADFTDKVSRPLIVISKLGKAQFVYWDYLTEDFTDAILSKDDVNKALREICEKDKFCKVNNTIDLCTTHHFIDRYKRIFSQSIHAYRNRQYELAAVGILSVIDGILSEVSGNLATNIAYRAKTILQKTEETDYMENKESVVFVLTWTFSETMNSISANRYFNSKEPENLNRHWIMHGRSNRKRTQLDCIKLFNFLYGILLLNDLGKTE